jgi:RNA polymerase sigma factor (sigma-70 family)
MNPENTYLSHLVSIERIAAFVARRGRLNADESAEFVQVVRVRLFEDDYAIIRKFEGRSSFTTYLTTVIIRLFHQSRVEQWGKWRPSAEAKRLGDTAITLERLLTRDGFTLSEAVNVLTTRAGAGVTVAELESLYARLPLRNPRPVLVSDDGLTDAVPAEDDVDDRLGAGDRERAARLTAQTVDAVLAKFDAEDRVILQMRFWHGRKVPDIARILHLDQKKVYKRLDKLFATLRRALETAGVGRGDVDRLLGRGDQDIRFDLLTAEENPAFRPSHPTGEEEVRGGEGRLP